MVAIYYITKKEIKSYNNDAVIEEINSYLMPFDDLKYHGNLNKANEENGILVFFFTEYNDNEFFGFAQLLPYSKSQIKRFNLPNKTYEISDVFIFEEFRGKDLCKEMIEIILEEFSDFTFKITVETDNIPAIKCYEKYFQDYDNDENVNWLVHDIWKLKGNRSFKTMINLR